MGGTQHPFNARQRQKCSDNWGRWEWTIFVDWEVKRNPIWNNGGLKISCYHLWDWRYRKNKKAEDIIHSTVTRRRKLLWFVRAEIEFTVYGFCQREVADCILQKTRVLVAPQGANTLVDGIGWMHLTTNSSRLIWKKATKFFTKSTKVTTQLSKSTKSNQVNK